MNFKDTALGIEFGSTRIKAVLIDKNHNPIASGSHEWENRLENGIWTYSEQDIIGGLQDCYAGLKKDVQAKFGAELTEVGAIGVSAMMHGYLPFDENWKLLVPFRTWRNTVTGPAAEKLSELFNYNIPQRWCIAHLYQAILNKEEHIPQIKHISTLAGYVHKLLTGENVVGIGEASGIIPLDYSVPGYDEKMLADFDALPEVKEYGISVRSLLPDMLPAGEFAGKLTEEGAKLLDPSGALKAGIPFVPCEGDAETGMVATNAVRKRTGNVSAGTSDFAMIVLEKPIAPHREVGIVATPSGLPVAMVHCSNCTSDINAWVSLFNEFANLMGFTPDKGEMFTKLFKIALEGDPDCGGLISYNYFSGESVTDLNEGRPVFTRTPDCSFTLANFMRTHLLSALATLKIGLDILKKEENVEVDRICGHGGYFKTPGVGQRFLSAAIGAPVTVMETAGEGGPFGMALLGAYSLWREEGVSLEDYLDGVFAGAESSTVMAEQSDIDGFTAFLERYVRAFDLERIAVEKVQ